MLKRIGYFIIAALVLSACQNISDKELTVLQAQASKAQQLEAENSRLKSKEASLTKTVDELKTQLEQEITDHQAFVEKNAAGAVKVTMQQEILFPSNSYQLNQIEAADILMKVASSLNQGDGTPNIRIVGHSDNLPIAKKWRSQFSDNWDLSARRAGEIARYFIWGAGFPPENITVSGRADVEPVDTNDTKEGRERNRRIEIFIGE